MSAPADQSGQRCAARESDGSEARASAYRARNHQRFLDGDDGGQRVCMQCIQRTKEIQALRAEADRLRRELALSLSESRAIDWTDGVLGGLVGIGFAATLVGVLWALGRIATVIGGAS